MLQPGSIEWLESSWPGCLMKHLGLLLHEITEFSILREPAKLQLVFYS